MRRMTDTDKSGSTCGRLAFRMMVTSMFCVDGKSTMIELWRVAG